MNDYKKDFSVLALHSEMAKEMIESGDTVYIADGVFAGLYSSEAEHSSMHPTGNCGCILCNDDYFFGIRCEHFMWTEFWTEDSCKVIVIYGNHKGELIIKSVFSFDKGFIESEFDGKPDFHKL